MDQTTFQLLYFQLRDALAADKRAEFDQAVARVGVNPVVIFGASVIGGFVGLDRFLLGDWGRGLLKLILIGGGGAWAMTALSGGAGFVVSTMAIAALVAALAWLALDWFSTPGEARKKTASRMETVATRWLEARPGLPAPGQT